jgi:hypothetical protein
MSRQVVLTVFWNFFDQITILNRTQLIEALRYKPEGRGFNSQ